MEKSIAVAIIAFVVIAISIYLFKKYYLKFLKYNLVITKGTTSFIKKYQDCICAWIRDHVGEDDYLEKKEAFDNRYNKTLKQSQRYVKRLFIFRLIECLIKRTTDEEELLSKELFFKEHTNLIKDVEAELP